MLTLISTKLLDLIASTTEVALHPIIDAINRKKFETSEA